MANIKDVAELAGVSQSTVSIVINGNAEKRKISKATQKKVWNAMKELHYIPNVSAKNLRSGNSQDYVIALFSSFDYRNIMMIRLLSGIEKEIEKSSTNMRIIIYPYKTGKLYKERERFRGNEFHIAIVANANDADLNFLENEEFYVPIILYNRIVDKYSSVKIKDDEIGRVAAKHLYEQGYRKPAVIHGMMDFQGAVVRMESYIKAFQDWEIYIEESNIIYSENSLESGAKYAKELLEKPRNEWPDCYYCFSDAIALGFVNELASQGVKIPEDLGVIAIGNIDPQFSAKNNPPISVINIPIEKMGEKCYELINNNFFELKEKPQHLYVEIELFERESTNKN